VVKQYLVTAKNFNSFFLWLLMKGTLRSHQLQYQLSQQASVSLRAGNRFWGVTGPRAARTLTPALTKISSLGRSLKRKGPSPFSGPVLSHVYLFLDLRLPRPCRRPIAVTKTLAASAIPPL